MTQRAWLSAAAYSGMFGFGIVMALLGAILPLVSARLGVDLAQAGWLFAVMNGTMLVTSLALGPLLDTAGAAAPLRLAPLVVGAGLIVIAGAGGMPRLALGCALLGAGGAALNQTTNTLIATLHSDARTKSAALNLLGVFFGVGALFVPFTIGALVNRIGFAAILNLAAVLSALTAAIAFPLTFPAPGGRAPEQSTYVELARQPLVLTLAALLFFESGNEFVLAGFISTHLTRTLGASVATAAYVLAGYWAALMAMRILLSRILRHMRGGRLVLASALGVAAGAVGLIAAPSAAWGAAAAVWIGASISAIFPTTLGLAGSRYPAQSGTVFGILIGVGLAGGMSMPWLAGQAGQHWDIRAALAIVAANALAIFCLELAAMRTGNQ